LQINSYIYGNDDPVNRVDPIGTEAIEEKELNTFRAAEEVAVEKLAYKGCVDQRRTA